MLSHGSSVTVVAGLTNARRAREVIAVEDLIVLKLLAGGPGDLADVADLLERAAGPLVDLKRRAAERGVLDLLRQVRASIGR
jgi:hypothetical protein